MKITKAKAIEFFRDGLGFAKAEDWPNDKLAERLKTFGEKVKPEDVKDDYKELYKELTEANGSIELELPKEEKADKPAKSKKDKGEKAEKSDKPAKGEKKEKKEKKDKPKKEKKDKPRDAYGAALGTIRAAVNATFSKDWKGEEEITEEAGVKQKQARIRLRRAVKNKILEVRRRIEYRLVPKK